ncbi:hypothetical protein ABGB18_39075 [Nonomuraea sp. B12E4]|uniref:hypothetical protein n=1 Tax=Nonomuraea sp. B12E4 TaxID=3153564 RepID=UPI00325D9075
MLADVLGGAWGGAGSRAGLRKPARRAAAWPPHTQQTAIRETSVLHAMPTPPSTTGVTSTATGAAYPGRCRVRTTG